MTHAHAVLGYVLVGCTACLSGCASLLPFDTRVTFDNHVQARDETTYSTMAINSDARPGEPLFSDTVRYALTNTIVTIANSYYIGPVKPGRGLILTETLRREPIGPDVTRMTGKQNRQQDENDGYTPTAYSGVNSEQDRFKSAMHMSIIALDGDARPIAESAVRGGQGVNHIQYDDERDMVTVLWQERPLSVARSITKRRPKPLTPMRTRLFLNNMPQLIRDKIEQYKPRATSSRRQDIVTL